MNAQKPRTTPSQEALKYVLGIKNFIRCKICNTPSLAVEINDLLLAMQEAKQILSVREIQDYVEAKCKTSINKGTVLRHLREHETKRWVKLRQS